MKMVTSLLILACASHSSTAFTARRILHTRQSSTWLAGISEWRDLDFDIATSPRPLGAEQGPLAKSVCILPFGYDEALLQGETKQLRLYEERFLQLFDDAQEHHAGVVAMGLLAESGIIQTVPLCEIESSARMEGFGIFVTIRCVGRAQLIQVTQTEPYLKATCTELSDKLPPNMELPNLLASNIEEVTLWLTSSERRLDQAKQNKGTAKDEDGNDSEMLRRINIAKLEDRFYSEPDDDREEEDDEEDDEDDDDDTDADRLKRFRTAYQVAMDTDTQGYQLVNQEVGDRTPQELTAISWAAFCTDNVPEPQDAMFRVQALDTDNLFDRLKLAVFMLRAKKKKLMQQIEKAGLKGSDFDEETGI